LWTNKSLGLYESWKADDGGWNTIVHHLRGSPAAGSIVMDHNGKLWRALDDGSLRCWEVIEHREAASGLRLVREFHTPPILCFIIARNGRIYASLEMDKGMEVLEPTRKDPVLMRITDHEGLPGNSIRAICEDSSGVVWVGGFHDGIAMLDPTDDGATVRKRFTTDSGLPNNDIRAITADTKHRILIGTRYGGLAVLEHDRIRVISVKDGLLSPSLWSISQESTGRTYLSTQAGIQELDDTLLIPSPAMENLPTVPVFQSGIFAGGSLWMVTPYGITFIDTSRIHHHTVPPLISIDRFQINGRDTTITGSPEFPYTENNCTIDFSGTYLHNEAGVRYEYKLDEQQSRWQGPTTVRSVSYPAMPPGHYRFLVRALNEKWLRSDSTASLTFTILPPFWRRAWFLLISSVLVMIAVVSAIRVRIAHVLAIERVRSAIATDLHDDIGSGLTRIALLSDVARMQADRPAIPASEPGNADSLESTLRRMGSIARDLVDAMSDVVWSVDPTHDTIESLIRRVRAFAVELCDAKGIVLGFQVDPGVASMKCSAAQLRTLLLVSKEALVNVAKHSGATEATFRVSSGKREIDLVLTDNGQGFDLDRERTGNGLTNIQTRVTRAGGLATISSRPGGGSMIRVSLPV
jgi:signal transduction histidine kinase